MDPESRRTEPCDIADRGIETAELAVRERRARQWIAHRKANAETFEAETRFAGRGPVELARVVQGEAEFIEPPLIHFSVVIPRWARGAQVEIDYGDGWLTALPVPFGLQIPPVGIPVSYRLPNCGFDLVAIELEALTRWLADDRMLVRLMRTAQQQILLPQAGFIFDAMWEAAADEDETALEAVESGALFLLTLLIREAEREGGRPPRLQEERFARVIDYIEDNIGRPLRNEELAGVANLSPYHFSRAFRAVTGRTPHRYVMDRRIEKAKGLLRSSRLDLAAIAAICGFASATHLSQAFQARVGTPPGRWRLER